MKWLRPFEPWIEQTALRLAHNDTRRAESFAEPPGEPALVGHDSVTWQVFRNPISILVGGIAAVALELAEPRVRAGVYEHSDFRRDPLARLQRTGHATMVTVYGARGRAEALIAGVTRRHGRVAGRSDDGRSYSADDPELLTWVHATASYGFLAARHAYVQPIHATQRDRFYGEGRCSAALYGALDSPDSEGAMTCLLERYRPVLEPSPLLFEFLETMQAMPLLPTALAPIQRLLVRAAIELLPGWARERLRLGHDWSLAPWQCAALRAAARELDKLVLVASPPVQACRRLGLPDDYLVKRRLAFSPHRQGHAGSSAHPPAR